MEEKKPTNPDRYKKPVRCPVHNKLIGKYDARFGIINTTYYCPHCKKEYTFTIKREEIG